ncbi:MAG: nucleoside-triphosphatase [Chloroflexota bacterium]|nr:nucleoside-triphosphatase [Chloroflexota bacterium]
MNTPAIILLTGEMRTGKSTLCQKLAQRLRENGISTSGLITEHPTLHSLEAVAIHTNERYLLTYPFESRQGRALTHFRMNPAAMARSTEALTTSFPTQVFIFDELGPLELLRGEGWNAVFHLLANAEYLVAFIVVRPMLLAQAIQQLPHSIYTLAHITLENRDSLAEALLQRTWRLFEKDVPPPRYPGTKQNS